MKKIILLLICIYSFCFISARDPLKIAILSDLHLLSPELMDNGFTINKYANESGKYIMATPDIFESVLSNITDCDYLLITGDLSKDGELLSHQFIAEQLEQLKKIGVQTYVIPGNHDINYPKTSGYKGNTTYPTKNTTPKDFKTIYSPFGYDGVKNISNDSNSLSYTTALDDNTWLLALDLAKYDEYDKKLTSSGKLKEETIRWAERILAEAKTKKKRVIAMSHWGITEHFAFQSKFFPDYVADNANEIVSLLADNNVELILSGHFHANDITAVKSRKGNKIYDIETGSLCSYPFSLRKLLLNENKAQITTSTLIDVNNSEKTNLILNENELALRKIASNRMKPMLNKTGINFEKEDIDILANIGSELFIQHMKGNEELTLQNKEAIQKVFKKYGFPVDFDEMDLKLDLAPSDLNIIISLKAIK